MFYGRLAEEYNLEAQILRNYISKLKRNYAKEIAMKDIQIYKRVTTLYDMYLDLKYTGNFLKLRSEQEYGKIS